MKKISKEQFYDEYNKLLDLYSELEPQILT